MRRNCVLIMFLNVEQNYLQVIQLNFIKILLDLVVTLSNNSWNSQNNSGKRNNLSQTFQLLAQNIRQVLFY
jgi:hypothetical protein